MSTRQYLRQTLCQQYHYFLVYLYHFLTWEQSSQTCSTTVTGLKTLTSKRYVHVITIIQRNICTYSNILLGSHKLWKSWKTWKITPKSSLEKSYVPIVTFYWVPTSSGNHGKPGKLPKKVPRKNHGICKNLNNHGKNHGIL